MKVKFLNKTRKFQIYKYVLVKIIMVVIETSIFKNNDKTLFLDKLQVWVKLSVYLFNK